MSLVEGGKDPGTVVVLQGKGSQGVVKVPQRGRKGRRRGVLLLVDEGGRWELRVLLLRREEADGLVDGA